MMNNLTDTKLDLHQSVSTRTSVGSKVLAKLNRLGIQTIKDLLFHFPRRWLDLTNPKLIGLAQKDQLEVIAGQLQEIKLQIRRGRKRAAAEAILIDAEGAKLKIIWLNQPYLVSMLKSGQKVILVGMIKWSWQDRTFIMWNPKIETNPQIIAIYPETERLNSKYLSKLITPLLTALDLPDILTIEERDELNLPQLLEAMKMIHRPISITDASIAQRRLALDEFIYLLYQLQLEQLKLTKLQAPVIEPKIKSLRRLAKTLPFSLTNSQRIVAWSIIQKMKSEKPSNILIQGDVGSGKTITALLGALSVLKNGYHVLWMAPTQILAIQLQQRLEETLKPLKLSSKLIISGTNKKNIEQDLAPTIFVGTHALINLPILSERVGLVIVDEQHRFGVKQREALFRQTGQLSPHIITMTATPIPRSLALTIYSDLELLQLKEKPKHQTQVETSLITPNERELVGRVIKRELTQGRQGFIVFPRIKNNIEGTLFNKLSIEDIRDIYQKMLPEISIAIYHGQLPEEQKIKIIEQFSNGAIQLLIATSIIEVGIDIPNATVMVIEEAELFGLAQLHQIRGRVGRGQHPGTCFVVNHLTDQDATKRLRAFVNCHDGFELAELDLEYRGAGDLLGIEQSGLPPLKLARLGNWHLAQIAKPIAQRLVKNPPDNLAEWLQLYQ